MLTLGVARAYRNLMSTHIIFTCSICQSSSLKQPSLKRVTFSSLVACNFLMNHICTNAFSAFKELRVCFLQTYCCEYILETIFFIKFLASSIRYIFYHWANRFSSSSPGHHKLLRFANQDRRRICSHDVYFFLVVTSHLTHIIIIPVKSVVYFHID